MKPYRVAKIKLDKQEWKEILENAMSWIVVMGMFIYGVAKYNQFEGSADSTTPVSELTAMQLMWAFYGYSKTFAITIGVFEIIGGVLILIKRTRIIGCLFTSAILVNIILQDLFFNVHIGALKAAVLYQLLIVIVLWLNRKKLIESLKTLLQTNKVQQPKHKVFKKLSLAFLLFIAFRVLEYYLTIGW